MSIQVKGINDVLVLKMSIEKDVNLQLKELETLLEEPLFNQEGFFPKAFFDFGCHEVSQNDLLRYVELLQRKKKILFEGVSIARQKHMLEVRHEKLRNGEEIFIEEETLFVGTVNPGSHVYCFENVYFLNKVKGTIVLMREDVRVFGHHFEKAQFVINQTSLHDLTTSALVSVYYKEEGLRVEKEDCYEQNNGSYIW